MMTSSRKRTGYKLAARSRQSRKIGAGTRQRFLPCWAVACWTAGTGKQRQEAGSAAKSLQCHQKLLLRSRYRSTIQYYHCTILSLLYFTKKTLLLRSRYHSTIIASLLRSQYHVQYNIITAQYCHFYGRDRAARTGLCSGFEQHGAVTQKLPAREADERMRIQKTFSPLVCRYIFICVCSCVVIFR